MEPREGAHLTHTAERPYPAPRDAAGPSCRRATHVAHEGAHGERPFPCALCDRNFTHKTNLKRHMSVHTREHPSSASRAEGHTPSGRALFSEMASQIGILGRRISTLQFVFFKVWLSSVKTPRGHSKLPLVLLQMTLQVTVLSERFATLKRTLEKELEVGFDGEGSSDERNERARRTELPISFPNNTRLVTLARRISFQNNIS
ncbi:hypothetical protein CEXT_708791 [Caerostris extrusa]|uniref:C2H2-type domain-containing protein n=1 Tax=Caerostris extrusa TaxID=172846 RepID=A0AAV4VJ50_CAEEX|nr:hypothetical protein CEXT_708791 [Caerostris extrusa]